MTPKFRAWDKVAEDIFIPEVLELDKYGKVTGIFSKGTMFSIEDFELLQSTGLFDKNGAEIYEGDIVDCYTEGLSTVEFEHGCFGLVCNGYFEGFVNVLGKLEVIGNKFEHPHLLGEDNQ